MFVRVLGECAAPMRSWGGVDESDLAYWLDDDGFLALVLDEDVGS